MQQKNVLYILTNGLIQLQKQNNYAVVPKWVTVMYKTIFFRACMAHPQVRKNELDRFCVDCHRSLCFNCLPAHACHKHIKIRRYIYSDVINRKDLCKLFNCSGIQTYLTNKAKVLFLKQRNQNQQRQQLNSKEYYRCIICDRSLQDNSLYCSIACKVAATYGSNTNTCNNEEVYLPLFKRRNLKPARKGVPLRAPLF
ncbi:hypothetical protein Tsubulata_039795 [Turnera subulata]|uniref:B box-type domain-containing protein n=1 Tax=Turnera subulata TaxID=218843 RepID=A0A9Q0FDA2_9ROSI|nr:hypothetical protein Tsubulata_039795 [Turnera subulata]